MILLKINLINFKQYKELDLEFSQGLTGIIGKNGSGKSSIFEAILLALYGEIPFKKDYLRTSTAGEKDPVLVELEFEVNEKYYRVVREFKGRNLNPSGGLYDHNNEMIATGQTEVTSEIIKIVGMVKDAFTRSVFSGQKELGAISSAKGTERRLLVRKMVGMNRIDEIQKLIREDRNRIKNEVSGQEKLLFAEDDKTVRKNSIEDLAKTLNTLVKENDTLSVSYKKSIEAYKEARKEFSSQQKLYRQYSKSNGDLIKINEGIDNTKKNISTGKEKLKNLEKCKKELDEIFPKEKRYAEVKKEKEKIDSINIKFVELKGLAEHAESFKKNLKQTEQDGGTEKEEIKKLGNVESEHSASEKELKDFDNRYDENNKLLLDLKKRSGEIEGIVNDRKNSIKTIKKAGKDSQCPTCLRPLIDAYDSTIDRLNSDLQKYTEGDRIECNKKINAIQSEINDLRKRRSDTNKKIKSLNEKLTVKKQKEQNLDRLKTVYIENKKKLDEVEVRIKKIGVIDYDDKAHKAINEEFNILTKVHERYLALSERIKEIPNVEKEIKTFKNDLKKLVKDSEVVENEIKDIPYSEKKYNAADEKQVETEKEKDKLRDKLDNIKEKRRNIDEKIKFIKKELAEDEKRRKFVEEYRKEQVALDKLDSYMDGFKNAVLERVRPAISGYAGSLFQQLTRGSYESIEVDNDFNFNIMDDGKYYPIERFSGGEIDLANLCLRIGISRAVMELSGSGSAGFLGFDEIFGSQDRERREEIMNAFHNLQEIYRQIFVISHVDDVKEEFPRILEVSRGVDGSIVKGFGG